MHKLYPVDAADLLQLALPSHMAVRFPGEREQLLLLVKQDQRQQKELPSWFSSQDWQNYKRQFYERSARLMSIMGAIRTPSVQNIGPDGSRAAWLLAQHSPLDIMRIMLDKFEYLYYKDKESAFYQGIPFLRDRVRIFQMKPQLYGTQRYVLSDGREKYYPVRGFDALDQRRMVFGLAPLELKVNGEWPQE